MKYSKNETKLVRSLTFKGKKKIQNIYNILYYYNNISLYYSPRVQLKILITNNSYVTKLVYIAINTHKMSHTAVQVCI